MVKKIAAVKPAGAVTTQRELARMANVSMTTIYNVLHQPELVNPATLKAIRRIMDECDYSPDALAQAMVRGKSNIVGVMVPRFDIPYFANMVCRIERCISKRNYKCLMIQHDDDPDKAKEAIRVFRQYRADGIICSNTSTAVNVYCGLKELGIRVPEELKLLGFGGLQNQAVPESQNILTVRHDIDRIAGCGGYHRTRPPAAAGGHGSEHDVIKRSRL